jgi:hypothetical protein
MSPQQLGIIHDVLAAKADNLRAATVADNANKTKNLRRPPKLPCHLRRCPTPALPTRFLRP